MNPTTYDIEVAKSDFSCRISGAPSSLAKQHGKHDVTQFKIPALAKAGKLTTKTHETLQPILFWSEKSQTNFLLFLS